MNVDALIAGAYVASTALLGLLGLHRAWLLLRFRRRPRQHTRSSAHELPRVTVQLPLFNERTVAARAIRALGALDWPRDRFELQVLDDSNDETCAIVRREVQRLVRSGVRASILRRAERAGFKAGALAAGLKSARGELIAIFDADFVPAADFLRRLAGAFADPRVGMVQARWTHMNRDASALTRAQATLLDGHFVITHQVRFERGLYIHFNGTAGIWRRRAIEAGGGWQTDTLTEDLDLSYRTELAGWRFVYATDVEAPAELPAALAGFKSQQTRWSRGTVQVARKLAGQVLRAPIAPRVKLEVLLHFAANAAHPLVLAVIVLLPFALARPDSVPQSWYFALLALCAPTIFLFYEASQRALGRPFARRAVDSLLAIVLGLGMSVELARAALRGLRREVGSFVRTPKQGGSTTRAGYRAARLDWAGSELVFAAWAGFGLVVAVRSGAWGAVPFLVLYVAGFIWVGGLSLIDARRAHRPPAPSVRPAARERERELARAPTAAARPLRAYSGD